MVSNVLYELRPPDTPTCRMPSTLDADTPTSTLSWNYDLPTHLPLSDAVQFVLEPTTTSRHTYLCQMPSSLSWNYDLPTHLPLSDAVQFVLELQPPDTPTSVRCRPVCPGTTTSRHTYLCRMPSTLSWNYDLPTHLPLSDAVQFVLELRPPDTPTSVGCRPVCPGTKTSRHTYLCRMPSSLSWNYDLPTHLPLSDAVQFVLEPTTTSRHTYLCQMPSSLSWNYDLPTHLPLLDAVQFVLELRPPDTPTSVGCRPVCPGTKTSRHTYLCRMPSSLSWN